MSTAPVSGLRQVGRSVVDLDRAVEFHRDVLGLTLIQQFGEQLAFFDIDGVRLMLETNPVVTPNDTTLYLQVADIHAAVGELEESGVVFIGEPHVIFDDPTGIFGAAGEEEWMAFFHDPDGNLLALASRIPA